MLRSVPDRVNRLFDVMHRAATPPVTNAEVAERITLQGVAITEDEIRQLRAGTKQDASMRQLSALAEFFGVAARYLTDPNGDRSIDAQLTLLEAMRDSGVQGVHRCRTTQRKPETLSPKVIEELAQAITRSVR